MIFGSDPKPKFEIVRTSTGEISIRNNVVNEIMHNPVGPWAEANLLYIEASGLRNLLQQTNDIPLVVFDVGLGAAANALATIAAWQEVWNTHKKCRPLTIVSFENDLTLLAFVIQNIQQIPYIADKGAILEHLLQHHSWQSPDQQVNWILHQGDFLETIGNERRCPDIVFYDPYSPAVNSEMWGLEAFTKLYRSTDDGQHTCALYTYSRATHVRTAMLAAGFFVGAGTSTGLKDETTQAATRSSLLTDALEQRWLLRWLRSHCKFPTDCTAQQREMVTNYVLNHPQFKEHYPSALLEWDQKHSKAISWQPDFS